MEMRLYSVVYIVIVSLASATAGDSHVFVIMYELLTMRDGKYHMMVAVIFKAVFLYICVHSVVLGHWRKVAPTFY